MAEGQRRMPRSTTVIPIADLSMNSSTSNSVEPAFPLFPHSNAYGFPDEDIPSLTLRHRHTHMSKTSLVAGGHKQQRQGNDEPKLKPSRLRLFLLWQLLIRDRPVRSEPPLRAFILPLILPLGLPSRCAFPPSRAPCTCPGRDETQSYQLICQSGPSRECGVILDASLYT